MVENGRTKRGDVTNVGIDGRILSLNTWSATVRRALNVNDVIYVHCTRGRGQAGGRADMRIRPRCRVQRSCWKIRPAGFWRWPALFLSGKSA